MSYRDFPKILLSLVYHQIGNKLYLFEWCIQMFDDHYVFNSHIKSCPQDQCL